MFGFGKNLNAARKDQPSTARRKSGGTLRKAEYERRKAQRMRTKESRPRTRESEAARVALEYRERRAKRFRSRLPLIVAVVLALGAAIAFAIHSMG